MKASKCFASSMVRKAAILFFVMAAAAQDGDITDSGGFYTTNFGVPVASDNASLTVGARGPVLLSDYQNLEKISTFGRERIPERVVHARGTAARGTFEVTDDITNFTFADVFSTVGKQTDVIVRFSVVTGPSGSPEWLRDPRGFAIKFYTSQGNWDLVGNNLPVFFIRDGAQFPDLAHALKASPVNRLNPGWRPADFLSWHPESMNMVTYLFDDVGIPLSYRQMNGSSVNTYTLISSAGKVTYVKFQWKPAMGEASLLDDQVGQVAQAQPDGSFATADLYNAIAASNFPVWYFYIQTRDPSMEDGLSFDPLDPTKIWPEEQFPLQRVGKLSLNQNTGNFFNEIEQLAFSPAHIVPGIGYSNDKLLQWRLQSYDDTQRYRIGPNFGLLPVNRPISPVFNNRADGPMNILNQSGAVNYFPSEFATQEPVAAYPYDNSAVSGQLVRTTIYKTDDFTQPGERYRSFDLARQARFVARISGLLGSPMVNDGIRARWMSYLQQMDAGLASKVQYALEHPSAPAPVSAVPPSMSGGRRHMT